MIKESADNPRLSADTILNVEGRGDPTRTGGLYVPNVARYQLRHTPRKVKELKSERVKEFLRTQKAKQ